MTIFVFMYFMVNQQVAFRKWSSFAYLCEFSMSILKRINTIQSTWKWMLKNFLAKLMYKIIKKQKGREQMQLLKYSIMWPSITTAELGKTKML